jgi:hypothetical protein
MNLSVFQLSFFAARCGARSGSREMREKRKHLRTGGWQVTAANRPRQTSARKSPDHDLEHFRDTSRTGAGIFYRVSVPGHGPV